MRIPFISTPDRAISDTTQDLIPVADIVDDIVVYKHGGASLIMESTSLNFGLLSEREQQAVIVSYAGILNSFNFPVQIVVRTQKKDISSYMRFLDSAQAKVKNDKLRFLMQDYQKFIQDAIQKKNVLSKRFYVIVPFTQYELGIAKSMVSSIRPTKVGTALPYPKSYVVRKAKISLFPKRDHLIRQAGRLGLKFRQLKNDELLELFFNVYNPEPPIKEGEIFNFD